MLAFWKIAGLKNSLWLMPTLNQTEVIYDYPHCYVEINDIDHYNKGYRFYKVSYIEESNIYKVEYLYLGESNDHLLQREYTKEKDPIRYSENPIEIYYETFDRIKALVKPLFDLLYEDYFIGPPDDTYLTVGHCFYYEDELGWYICRVYFIELTVFYFKCIKVDPDHGIDATTDCRTTSYNFFKEYQPKFIDPEFFDYVWNLYKTTKERALDILFGRE